MISCYGKYVQIVKGIFYMTCVPSCVICMLIIIMYYRARMKNLLSPKSTLSHKKHKNTALFSPYSVFCVSVSKQTSYSINLIFRTAPQHTFYLILCERFLKCSVEIVKTTSYIYIIRDNLLGKNRDVWIRFFSSTQPCPYLLVCCSFQFWNNMG